MKVGSRTLLVVLTLAARIVALLELAVVEPVAHTNTAGGTQEGVLLASSRCRLAIHLPLTQGEVAYAIAAHKKVR